MHLEAPCALRAGRGGAVTKLRKWNPEFSGPAVGVDASADVPHGVPVEIRLVVVGCVGIALDTLRVRSELKRCAAIVIGVDVDQDPVGITTAVTAGELRGDGVRMR